MDDSPAPPTPPNPRGSRRPAPRRLPTTLAWLVGTAAALALAALIALRWGISHYLSSGAFVGQLERTLDQSLGAHCRLDGLSWQDPAIYAASFSAQGSDGAPFRSGALSDLRAEVDSGALWDRVWKVRHVKVAQMSLDFSPATPLPAPPPSDLPSPPSAPGWLQNWLPNRAELGPVTVDRFDFVRSSPEGLPALSGHSFALVLQPNLLTRSTSLEARSGQVRLLDLPHPLLVDRLRATLRLDGAALDHLEGRLEDATFSAEGTLSFLAPADLHLIARLRGASLARWLPEDWVKRCTGTASAKATLRGDWRQPQSLRADGDFQIQDGVLQALPLLDIIAKKTQNASFLRMQIKQAEGKFERRGPSDWLIRQLRADAPGLLRLKGDLALAAPNALRGSLLLGIVPGTLRYLAGAEQSVFLTADRFAALPGNARALAPDDSGLLWTRFALSGTLADPQEDLSDRLAQAWFNATVAEVSALSMEAASTAARTAASAADSLLQAAPPALEKAPELIQKGLDEGLKLIDGLLPR